LYRTKIWIIVYDDIPRNRVISNPTKPSIDYIITNWRRKMLSYWQHNKNVINIWCYAKSTLMLRKNNGKLFTLLVVLKRKKINLSLNKTMFKLLSAVTQYTLDKICVTTLIQLQNWVQNTSKRDFGLHIDITEFNSNVYVCIRMIFLKFWFIIL